MKYIILRNLTSALLIALGAASLPAQNVEILGFSGNVRTSQILAKVDLEGKTLSGVNSFSYRMTDGANVVSTDYALHDAGDGTYYLSANIDSWSGTYDFFQLELLFSDGKRYRSESINRDMTEAFYWLGDIPMSSYATGWDGYPPVADRSVETGYKMIIDDIIYYKGMSNHAPGNMVFKIGDFPIPAAYSKGGFNRFVTRVGVQDDKTDGDVRFRFVTDGTQKASKDMYAKTNPSRNGAPCIDDVEFNIEGNNELAIYADMLDGNNWGDHAHHPLARLYLTMPASVRKNATSLKFADEGGDLGGKKQLNATLAGAEGKIFYRIVSGTDLATLNEDNTLLPKWGKKGEVIVEATYFGDDTHLPSTDYVIYNVDMEPRIEILELYPSSAEGISHRGYLYVDTKDARLASLNLKAFDNHSTLNEIFSKDFSDAGNGEGVQIIPFDIPSDTEANVLQLQYRYEGGETNILPYWENGERFDYMSDLPVRMQVGWGKGRVNDAYHDDNVAHADLLIGNDLTVYKKGFGAHAEGYVESTGDLSKYNRFATYIGGQKISNPTRDARITFGLMNGNTALVPEVTVAWETRLEWDTPINGNAANGLRINFKRSPEGNNTNNIVAIGAPRLYYYPVAKPSQEIGMTKEGIIHTNGVYSMTLDGEATSGLAVDYRVIKGREYATLTGNTLNITNIPADGSTEIVVEAYQPGNDVWGAAPAVTQTFRLVRGLEVQKDETVALNRTQTLDEVIVHADRDSSGQIRVERGIINVKKLVLKYSFTPGEWSYISFPSEVDIDRISDFKEKGFGFNNEFGGAYYIQSLAPGVNPSETSWVSLDSPVVEGMKGYAMSISDNGSHDPVEITFVFDNVALDMSQKERPVGVNIDLSSLTGASKQIVSVTPENVDGATLDIEVTYSPADLSGLPLDFSRALNEARYTFTDGRKGMRFTLPEQTPAKVVFFDKSGKKVIKAVKYISPMVIDISDLKRGEYNIAVEYGNATRIFKLEL